MGGKGIINWKDQVRSQKSKETERHLGRWRNAEHAGKSSFEWRRLFRRHIQREIFAGEVPTSPESILYAVLWALRTYESKYGGSGCGASTANDSACEWRSEL